jgi:tRNA(Ile)-lysidine synthase
MAELTGRYLRPLLSVTRSQTVEVCEATDLKIWNDPHNSQERFSRVRVRENVLPALEKELGPGIAESLARTADQLREDADALDELALAAFEEVGRTLATSIELSISGLEKLPVALRYRVIRIAGQALDAHFHRSHVLEIDRLVTNWHGQKPLAVPGVRVERTGENIVLKSTKSLKPGAC